jgi:hypothetical protein
MATGSKGSATSGTGAKRVVRTGLAVVHENEIVYPAAGSEAQALRAVEDASAEIEVHFPVVIEVMGGGTAAEATAEEAARTETRRLENRLRRS